MRKAKEILRQKWALGLSHRAIAASLRVGVGTVSLVATRAVAAGLVWESAKELTEEEIEARLYARPRGVQPGQKVRQLPDFAEVHAERLKPGVTLELLHLEYREKEAAGLGYTQFCEYYRRWLGAHALTMRQEHLAGDKLFVDYSGKKAHIVDRATGGATAVELFVGVLGASNYTFAEATATQRVEDFAASHVRMFEFFGGVTAALVPDQLKSGVTESSWYDPQIQRTYEHLAEHYGTAVVPARPGKPRDKAKVEVGVQIVQRWILARLRRQTFFSLDELNGRIRELLTDLNSRVMRRYAMSRRDLFLRTDQPALRALPESAYTFGAWSNTKVESDYHVEVDGHFYSVPHRFNGFKVEMCATATTVEVLRLNKRIALHVRSHVQGTKTTDPLHLPSAHRHHLEWTPERITAWAAEVGPSTSALTAAILVERRHPEAGYRSCLGILRLGKRYGQERLENACARAFVAGARSYRHVDSILKHGLDRLEVAAVVAELKPPPAENVRGASYYNK